jgi:propionate CoA-transferase
MIRYARGYLVPDNFRKLISAEEAVRKIRSNDVLVVSGFVAQGCPDHLLQALAEGYEKDGKPKDLTLLFGGGPGDYATKGLNRLTEKPGLLKRTIGGHCTLSEPCDELLSRINGGKN